MQLGISPGPRGAMFVKVTLTSVELSYLQGNDNQKVNLAWAGNLLSGLTLYADERVGAPFRKLTLGFWSAIINTRKLGAFDTAIDTQSVEYEEAKVNQRPALKLKPLAKFGSTFSPGEEPTPPREYHYVSKKAAVEKGVEPTRRPAPRVAAQSPLRPLMLSPPRRTEPPKAEPKAQVARQPTPAAPRAPIASGDEASVFQNFRGLVQQINEIIKNRADIVLRVQDNRLVPHRIQIIEEDI